MDFKITVDYLANKYKEYELYAIGHSYGANTLVKYLGLYNQEKKIKVACSVANPYNFRTCKETVVGTIYDKWLA